MTPGCESTRSTCLSTVRMQVHASEFTTSSHTCAYNCTFEAIAVAPILCNLWERACELVYRRPRSHPDPAIYRISFSRKAPGEHQSSELSGALQILFANRNVTRQVLPIREAVYSSTLTFGIRSIRRDTLVLMVSRSKFLLSRCCKLLKNR